MNIDETLELLAIDPTHPVDLAAVALYLAVDEYPVLDVQRYLSKLDRLAETVNPRLVGSFSDRIACFADYLFEECGFEGNDKRYYDPRNSYLNQVLDRKLGLPITLSLLAIAVVNRCGLNIMGVGLPGHFIAKAVDEDEEILFDPFHNGQFLDRLACTKLITAVTGHPFVVTDELLQPTAPGHILQRMLNNLKGIYLRTSDLPRAKRVLRRLVQLAPNDAEQHRDYGVCLLNSGEPGKAIDHLQVYLDAASDAPDIESIQKAIQIARREVANWN